MEGRRSGDQAEKGPCSSQTQPGPPSSMTAPDKTCTKVVLSDVPPEASTDHLVNFLECLESINCSVQDVQQGERSVVVAFDEPVDVAELQKACSENKLENCVLKVKKVDTRGAVVIRNPHPDTKTDCFKFYLQNPKRSGGSKVLDIHRDENNRFLIAYYASEDVAKQVAERSHELEHQKLQLKLYDPNLDVPPSSAEDSNVTSSTDPEPDPDTEKLQDTRLEIKRVVEGLHTVYLNVLDAFSELISDQFYGVQVTTDDTCVTIEGEQHAVETVEKLLHILLRTQKTSSYIKEVADKFIGWEDVFSDIQEDIDSGVYFLVLQEGLVDGCTVEELCIRSTYDDQLRTMSFDQFMESHVSKETVAVETKSAVELLSTTVWDEFAENDVEEKYGKKIQVFYDDNGSDRNVWVLGSVTLLEDACYSVKLFLQNTSGTCCIQLHPKQADFVNTFCTSVLARLQCGTGPDNAEINIEGEYIKIKGCRVGVRRAEKELNKIREKFRCKRAIFSHPELATIVQSEMWDQMIQSVSAECRCVITTLPDLQIPDADEDGEDWGMWSATVLHSFRFEEQLQCHLVEGKGEDLKVDAMILCCKGSVPSCQQHRPLPVPTSSQGQGEGARPKTSVNSREHQPLTQNGYIRVTQSGALPCKALIHVDLEHYFSQDNSAPVKASMKNLMADVFHECKHHHFTSLAVPVIGVDETWDRPVPIDKASEAIVKCFIDLNDHGRIVQAWKESCLRDVFLCSGRAACLRGLTYFLHGSNETEMPVPAPHRKSFEFLSSPAPKGSGKVPHKDSITITTGDISKAQADVLIVPLDIDIDLDLNKSKVTRSLSQQGGPYVQHTIKHGRSWGFDYDATPKRNEELAEKHVLVGSAGSLRASDIFYVFLPPWGPGVKQVLTSCVHKCLRKACDKHYKRAAMTALGTGSLGYPPEFVARTMLSAVADFMEQERITLENVNIVIFPDDRDSFKAFRQEHIEWQKHRVFAHDDSVDWQPLAPPHHTGYTSDSSGHTRSYADVAGGSEGRGRHRGRRGKRGRGRNSHNCRSSPHSHHHTAELVFPNPYTQMAGKCSSCVRIKQIKLCVKIGDITHEKCDIVVNSINDEFDFNKGGVSRAFKKECSDMLVSICNEKGNKKKMKKKGHVITLAPGLANCDRILHLDLARFMEKPQETIKKCLTAVLDNNANCGSVAFPALGTGASRSSHPEQLVEHVVQVIRDLKKPKNLTEVRLIASNRDLFVRLAARMQELVPSHPSNQPVKSQQHKPSQSADTAPKDMMTEHPEPTPPQASSVIVKGYSSDLTCGSAVSLFIFSSIEEDRQSATDEIALRIEEMLGPAKTDTSRKNDGQMAEGNRQDHGDREAQYGWGFCMF